MINNLYISILFLSHLQATIKPIIKGQRTFKDWLLIAYQIFGIIFTTLSVSYLSITGNQF